MPDESNKTSDEKSGSTRKMVLFGILGLLLIALAYDYRVARPNVELAYNQIVDRSAEVNADSTVMFTNMDVRKLLGKEPSRTFTDTSGDMVEVFSWRSGLPIKTHDLFAVYKMNGGKQMFYRHAKYKYDKSDDVSKYNKTKTVEAPVESGNSGGGGPGGGGAGGGGAGGGGAGGGGPGSGAPGGGYAGSAPPENAVDPSGGGGGRPGGGFDPDAFFAERDEDGDGIWKDDEISERARENLADIDKDEDGAISKEEWLARMETVRAQFGGGGGRRPGGGGGRPRQQSRPELDTEDETTGEDSQPKPNADQPPGDPPAAEASEPEASEPEASEPEASGVDASGVDASEADDKQAEQPAAEDADSKEN